MKMQAILDAIRDLSYSQGFYGRLYRALQDLHENDPDQFESVKNELEAQNFADTVDMVLYFES